LALGFVWVIVAVTKNDCRENTGLTRREIESPHSPKDLSHGRLFAGELRTKRLGGARKGRNSLMGDATARRGIGNPAPQGYGPVSTNSDKTEPLAGSARKFAPAATVHPIRAPQWRRSGLKK